MNELPLSVTSRLLDAMIGQRKNNTNCPMETTFKDKIALVTGGTGGIGKETVKGLLRRGIKVIVAARNEKKANEIIHEFKKENIDNNLIYKAIFDLGDLESLARIESQIENQIGENKIDILIENAGVWPQKFETTKQGYEIAFGTNVLGHFALRKILQKKLLSEKARVVCLTGDIYIMENECNGNLNYLGLLGGVKAYCQSKLGNIWIAFELQKRYPNLEVCIVHPGVIATDLGSTGSIGKKFKSLFMLSPEEGAQTSLYCATNDTIVKGGYYHNAKGLCKFLESDPASNEIGAKELWEKLEKLLNK